MLVIEMPIVMQGFHRQCHHSLINELWPFLGFSAIHLKVICPAFALRIFSTYFFLQGEVVSLMRNPQPGGPILLIYTHPLEIGLPAILPDTGYLGITVSHTHLHGLQMGMQGFTFVVVYVTFIR
jgi:hypothetical protein